MRCDSGRRAALRSVRAQLQPVPGSEGEPGPDMLRLILMRSVIVWRVQVEPVRTRLVGGEGPRVGYRQGADGARLGLVPVRLTARQ